MDTNTTAPTFVKRTSGYHVAATFKSGRSITIRVKSASRLNPSARGGAYLDGWEAKFGDSKGFGTTRLEALQTLQATMARHGLFFTF
jgi:hypothetical protein